MPCHSQANHRSDGFLLDSWFLGPTPSTPLKWDHCRWRSTQLTDSMFPLLWACIHLRCSKHHRVQLTSYLQGSSDPGQTPSASAPAPRPVRSDPDMTLIVTRTTFNQILIKEYIFTLYTEIGLAELNLLDSTVSQPHVIFSRTRFSLPAHISILPARFHSIHLPYRTPGYPVSQRCPNLHLQHISHWSSPFQPCILSHSPLHYLLSSLVPLCFLEGK